MCEANVYLWRDGKEELIMEKVDRIIPGEENTLFMENVFGERKVVAARLREMELVRHRILIEEMPPQTVAQDLELWLEPDTDHGHFHEGEEVGLKLYKGYNMKPESDADFEGITAYMFNHRGRRDLLLHQHDGQYVLHPGQEADGLIQVVVHQPGPKELYAKTLVEIGHHHHHDIETVKLPLEIVPSGYSHARIGEYYEIQLLKNGEPLPDTEIKATFSTAAPHEYPRRQKTDDSGRAKFFLSARGHYLFSVQHDNIISTFTLIKSV
jgi:predicted RNA-binding protein